MKKSLLLLFGYASCISIQDQPAKMITALAEGLKDHDEDQPEEKKVNGDDKDLSGSAKLNDDEEHETEDNPIPSLA